MEYSINQLASLSGVTARTLRYYDEIGLLKPLRANSAGYRIYGPEQVDRLQQILFYRELDFPLEEIRRILSAPDYDRRKAMESHRQQLLSRRQQLDQLIDTLTKTLECEGGKGTMTDKEKFEGFKKKQIEENEAQYGAEIRRRYGEQIVEESNAKRMGLTKEQYDRMQELDRDIRHRLQQAVRDGQDPAGEEGAAIAALHKEWLGYSWNFYSKEVHNGLVEMYVTDERFASYYDREQAGCAVFLRDAVQAWKQEDKSACKKP